jgi:hypothetical protein
MQTSDVQIRPPKIKKWREYDVADAQAVIR